MKLGLHGSFYKTHTRSKIYNWTNSLWKIGITFLSSIDRRHCQTKYHLLVKQGYSYRRKWGDQNGNNLCVWKYPNSEGCFQMSISLFTLKIWYSIYVSFILFSLTRNWSLIPDSQTCKWAWKKENWPDEKFSDNVK